MIVICLIMLSLLLIILQIHEVSSFTVNLIMVDRFAFLYSRIVPYYFFSCFTK